MSRRRRTPMRKTLAVVLLTGLAACGPATVDGSTTLPPDASSTSVTQPPTGPTPSGPATPTEALAGARARWDAAGLDTYQFVFQNDCGECDPEWAAPRQVVVWNGASFDGTRSAADVASLFELIESALAEGRDVEVSYDPELGFPTEIWIDREARAYDGGTHLLIHQVTPGLPGNSVSLADLEQARQRWATTRPQAYSFRTDIICDCPSDTTIWALIGGDRVVDWRIEWTREDGALDPAPSTVDQLFADLHDLFSAGELVEAGARISGSAAYHPELGYPTWIGLDIEILDPDSELAPLAPRLVVAIRDLTPQDLASSEHARAVDRWTRTGPDDYRYELTIHDISEASFGPPHQVTVRDGVVASVTVEGAEVEAGSVPAYAIVDLFAQIDTWRAEGLTVEVIYDVRLGHPVLVTAEDGNETIVFSIDRLMPG
jgi:hypothetical protein